MLRISKPLTEGHVLNYHKEEYAAADQAMYFSQGGKVVGEWHGSLATVRWGLTGGVSEDQYQRLAKGQDPLTEEQLISHQVKVAKDGELIQPRSGFDLTFAPHKSVSITILLGQDKGLLRDHDDSVLVAMDAMQEYTQARMGGSRPAHTTGVWAAALFRHDTARPVQTGAVPDMHIHTHGVVFNLTWEGKQYRSIQPHEWFKIQSYGTAVYQSEMAYRMRRRGYELEHGKSHSAAIKGYSPEYIKACSKRATQIEEALAEKGLSGAAASEYIGKLTRAAKKTWDPEDLQQEHRREAAEFGNQYEDVIRRAKQQMIQELSPEERRKLADSAIEFAKVGLMDREAVIDHYQLVMHALHFSQGHLRRQDIEEVLQERIGEFVEVDHFRKHAPGHRYTTPEMRALERALIESAQAGVNTVSPIRPNLKLSDFHERYPGLNDAQAQLGWQVLSAPHQWMGVQGSAGVGKTTVLKPIREILHAEGFDTIGLAATSKAAKELESAGLKRTGTLQGFVLRPNLNPAKRYAFVLDESSLTSTQQLHEILIEKTLVRPQDRLILVGDVKQHQSVQAGRIFEELQEAGMPTFHLDRIVRQQEERLKQVITAFSQGDIAPGLKTLDDMGCIHEVSNSRDRYCAIAQKFADSPGDSVALSPDNESRHEMNLAIRAELARRGHVNQSGHKTNILVPRQTPIDQSARLISFYKEGDVLRYSKRIASVRIKSGDYARVKSIDTENNRITVELLAIGKKSVYREITYDPRRVGGSGINLYEEKELQFAAGDRIQINRNWKAKGLANRDTGVIRSIDKHGNVRLKLDKSDRIVRFNPTSWRHCDYAYSMTTYSVQSNTYANTFLQINTADSHHMIDKTFLYVGASRASHRLEIFSDDKAELERRLNRLSLKPKALAPEQIQIRGRVQESTATYAIAV